MRSPFEELGGTDTLDEDADLAAGMIEMVMSAVFGFRSLFRISGFKWMLYTVAFRANEHMKHSQGEIRHQ